MQERYQGPNIDCISRMQIYKVLLTKIICISIFILVPIDISN